MTDQTDFDAIRRALENEFAALRDTMVPSKDRQRIARIMDLLVELRVDGIAWPKVVEAMSKAGF